MMNKVSPAAELIQNAIEKELKFLDLGHCNLSDNSSELELLRDCVHLEALNLGSYYYVDNNPIYSVNKDTRNVFTKIPETIPIHLKKLFINKTGVSDISFLNEMYELTDFDAFGNNIETLRFLKPNPNLITLGLSNNAISGTELSAVNGFTNLKSLYLGDNPLHSIEINFGQFFPTLEKVYLYNTQINTIDFLLGNQSVAELFINRNLIEDVSILKNLIHLKLVDLTDNPVVVKNPEFVNTDAQLMRSKLKNQSLAHTIIEENTIKRSSFLDFGNCALVDRSPELKLLKEQTFLKSISFGLGYYDENSTYVLSKNNQYKNRLSEIPENLPISLEELQIRDNKITTISNVDHLLNLKILDLSNNDIRSMKGAEALVSLTELALHNNSIAKLQKLPKLTQLKTLHLSYNALTSIENIDSYPSLEESLLYNNKIAFIEPLTRVKNLQTINIANNPIEDCPADIWSTNAILQIKAYFINKQIETNSALQNSSEKSNVHTNKINEDIEIKGVTDSEINKTDYKDIKLILLGNSANGKTNMVHFFEHGTFLETRKSTHGLEVKRWKPDVKKYPQLKDIIVSIWDFGGQEYYHDAYRLFMRNDSIYLILWCKETDQNCIKKEVLIDGGAPVDIEHFEKQYWLDTIKYYANYDINFPLILVQNKVDDLIKDRVKVGNEMMEKYSITDSFSLSLKYGYDPQNTKHYKNLNFFADYLADTIYEQVNKNSRHTAGFQAVRDEIIKSVESNSAFTSKIKDNLYISIDDFQEVCKQITNENTTFFPQWLDSSGLVIYFSSNEKLNDKLFINPKLISEKIYQILSFDILKNNGEIEAEKINLENPEIDFIEIMRNLNLIYDHPNKPNHFIAPQYLPTQHPIEDLFKIVSFNTWNESFWIKTSIFFYKKIMHRLLLHFINDANSDAKYYWKEGLIFIKNNTRILIKGLFGSLQECKIQVSIENTNQRDVLNKEMVKIIVDLFNSSNEQAQEANLNLNAKDFSNTTALNAMKSNLFYLENLEFSIDNIDYISYAKLDSFSKNINENKNEIYTYQHIYDFGTSTMIPKRVFVSYSHQNTKYVTKLRNHLAGLRRSNLIKDWTDREILPGERWDKKIKDELSNADVVILLLSADFFASDYIWDYELKGALTGNKKIIPIYVEPFDLAAIPQIDDNAQKIGSFEIIPKNENEQLVPVSLWLNEAEAFKKITERIRLVLNQQG